MNRFKQAVWWPWVVLGAAVIWNLVSLRAETVSASYLNDSSMHEQMVRFATTQLRSGHLGLTSWFPFLGEGSPQFLHYQSLPAILAGAIGVVTGPDIAFRWTLYLLLSLWPISVYVCARLFGAGRAAAAGAAAMAPFLYSTTGVGYEQEAYLWIGYGVWTQLWAMMTLPLAWGFGWTAIRDGRHRFTAVICIALTCAFHFETGYLALAPLIFWPFLTRDELRARVGRAAVLLLGAVLTIAWVIVPLLAQSKWAATNQVLQGTPLENGYGAGQVLGWLFSGQLLDHGRIPVVTAFALVGVVLACARWRSDPGGRALLIALVISLLLSFGRTTFGGLVAVIPGHADLFFRRFEMGVQLSLLLLAGRGAAWLALAICRGSLRWWPEMVPGLRRELYRQRNIVLAPAALLAAVILLYPAWHQLGGYAAANDSQVHAQHQADVTEGAEVDRLINAIPKGTGRVYAGMPTNFGADFDVGAVPVFKYLESRDVDEVGYTLRTASLMTDPEYYFDQNDPSDYRLFGIHYLILPAEMQPPVQATLTLRAGAYVLWTLPGAGGVLSAGSLVGQFSANRSDVGTQSIGVLGSNLADAGQYERVIFGGAGETSTPAQRVVPTPTNQPAAGAMVSQSSHLSSGRASGTVQMARDGVVVLSASFDPGWQATVDGHRAPTLMVAPALVAVRVPAGRHQVVFSYHGYGGYPWLFALAALTLILLAGADIRRRRRA